jgi:hypothetical protein
MLETASIFRRPASVRRYDAGVNDLNGLGFAFADLRLSDDQCDYISSSLPSTREQDGGTRRLLSHPTILALIRHKQLAQCLWSFTGRELVAVAARLVDCAVDADAPAEWHQGRVVAVRERMDVHGYGPWTMRLGVPHVEAPSAVLKQMIVLRVHLDAPLEEAPPFQVLPGSHRSGKLSEDGVRKLVATMPAIAPRVVRGSLLLMNPLLVHTAPARPARSRYRVLHLEFAPAEAISPLEWSTAVTLYRAA